MLSLWPCKEWILWMLREHLRLILLSKWRLCDAAARSASSTWFGHLTPWPFAVHSAALVPHRAGRKQVSSCRYRKHSLFWYYRCVIFHMNNCKLTLAAPCMFVPVSPGIVYNFHFAQAGPCCLMHTYTDNYYTLRLHWGFGVMTSLLRGPISTFSMFKL